MKDHSSLCRFLSPICLVLALAAAGCGSTPFPFDDGSGEDVVEIAQDSGGNDTQSADLQITFKTPDPSARPIVSGTYRAVFVYRDDANLPATLSIGFFKQPQIEPLVMQVDGSGEYSIEVDTLLVEDGNRSIQVTALSTDGRTVSKNGKILVDNNRPVIEILDPTPPAGYGFVDELPIRVRVTDSGSLIHSVTISVGSYSWEWPTPEDVLEFVPVPEIDTRTVVDEDAGTYTDLVISTEYWRGGDVMLKITAADGVQGRDSVVEHPMKFVERPGFDGGEIIDLPLSDVEFCESVEGIRLGPSEDGDWAMLAIARTPAGYALNIYQRSMPNHSTQVMKVLDEQCALYKIFDMNADGMDDILAWCGFGGTRRIVVLEQTADRLFVEATSIPTSYVVKDLTAGDLNGDGTPDIAFVSDAQPLWTGIVLSRIDGSGSFTGYGPPSFYSGAVKPNHVAIGRFSDMEHNAVVVGAKGSGLVTAYPVDENGIPSMGENSSLDPDNLFIDDVSDMVAVNFTDINADNDSLVVVDANNVEVMGVARLRQDASRRVESIREWPIGSGAMDVAAGDIDGNGGADVAMLCPGSNMVDIVMGKRFGEHFDQVSDVTPLVAGPATDVTLADMDMDGYLDVVLLVGPRKIKVIYFRMTPSGGRFDGSYQAVVPHAPKSVATGHFVEPLAGDRAKFLDAAVLYSLPGSFNEIAVYSSDNLAGQPMRHSGTVALDLKSATAIVAGNFDVDLKAIGSDPSTRPDDLIVSTIEASSELKPYSARVVLFAEAGHNSVAASYAGIMAGNEPAYAAVGDFDLGSGVASMMDVAFLWHYVIMDYHDRLIQLMVGRMDGSFSTTSASAGKLEPVSAGWLNDPILLKPFPLKRSLKRYLDGALAAPDLMVISRRSRDVTLFINLGLGVFQPKDLGSLDLAVGTRPIDVTAGYLQSRIDEDLSDSVAANQLPDLVTLLERAVLVSFSQGLDVIEESGADVGFENPVALEIGGLAPVAVEVADMNADGTQDIIVADREKSRAYIFVNLGNRRFAAPYAYPTGTGPVSMSVVDVNGDGCMDLVTADGRGKTISTLKNATQVCLD